MLRRTALSALTGLAVVLFGSVFSGLAQAAPVLRKTADVRGDILVIGNTMGWDCGAGNTPPAGSTVTCTGVLDADTAPDLYWRDNDASATRLATDARTSATLTLPSGATVAYARLYWSAILAGTALAEPPADTNVTFDRDGGFSTVVTADASKTLTTTGPGSPALKYVVYQSTADVTALVRSNGSGGYRASDIDSIVLNGVATDTAYSAWTLIVVFDAPGATYHHVQLFDGLDLVDPSTSVSVTASGFKIPATGTFTAKAGAWVYDGDLGETGDRFTFKGTNLTNASNPAANFWNSSRTLLGAPVSGLVPNLSGVAGIMGGLDLDVADVAPLLAADDTTATVGASTTADLFWIGGITTSVQSASPDLAVTKTLSDLHGGAIIPGDVLEFTITATNAGDDDAIATVLSDVLPAGLDYQAGTISIATGAGAGAKTDATGDDQGEFVAGTRTVTVRVGAGATSTLGGTLAPSASTSVKFRVVVSGAPRSASNQATITAGGALGAPSTGFLSDGDPGTAGAQATTFTVAECDASGGCVSPKVCVLATNTCVTPGGDAGSDADAGGDTAIADTGAGDASADGGGDAGGDAGDGAAADVGDGGAEDGGSDTALDASSRPARSRRRQRGRAPIL